MANTPHSSALDPTRDARGGVPAITIDGLILLAGLFTAITPWVVDDFAAAQRLVVQNLVLGIAVAVIGLVMTAVPARGYGLSWALIPLGVWGIISPWIVDQRPDGVLWTNVIMGAIIAVLGLAAAGLLVTAFAALRRPRHAPVQAQPSH
ncbi:hypothetical protein BJY24_004963 [Nocardia transvalensis]|uniref:SPW repeat-containing integral membrane domain-containing protein n=1 Tax=Nocardia transvalensis TaxID=37333 RepID=A0A7W9UK42_9NOCA|nr:SPW repeat protein [Nocardia transvalensis]MBB5916051.1 hypothetical protein [Nocardia transvalensis]